MQNGPDSAQLHEDLQVLVNQLVVAKNQQQMRIQQQTLEDAMFVFKKALIDKIKKNEQLFEQLMNALKTRNNLDQFKNQHPLLSISDMVNTLENRHGQSPLQHAFQTQNFDLAAQLVKQGAKIGPKEIAAFEIALDSQKAANSGIKQAYESKVKPQMALHDVKKYGLTLGIAMTSKDGTFSQFGHIEPTYRLITGEVGSYAKSLDHQHPHKSKFDTIAKAFEFANQQANFSGSKPAEQGAQALHARIQNKEVTTIPVSCAGHAMGMTIVPDNQGGAYMVFTNRGLGSKPGEQGTDIYRINNINDIKPDFINKMMNGHFSGTSHEDIMQSLKSLGGEPIKHIEQKAQKNDNCTIANTRANIRGTLECLEAIQQGVPVEELSENSVDSVHQGYKSFTGSMERSMVKQLTDDLRKDPQNADLREMSQRYLDKLDKKMTNNNEAQQLKALLNPPNQVPSIAPKEQVSGHNEHAPPNPAVQQQQAIEVGAANRRSGKPS